MCLHIASGRTSTQTALKVKWLEEGHRDSGAQVLELLLLGSFMCPNFCKRLKFTSEILEEKLLSWDTRKGLSGGCPWNLQPLFRDMKCFLVLLLHECYSETFCFTSSSCFMMNLCVKRLIKDIIILHLSVMNCLWHLLAAKWPKSLFESVYILLHYLLLHSHSFKMDFQSAIFPPIVLLFERQILIEFIILKEAALNVLTWNWLFKIWFGQRAGRQHLKSWDTTEILH